MTGMFRQVSQGIITEGMTLHVAFCLTFKSVIMIYMVFVLLRIFSGKEIKSV